MTSSARTFVRLTPLLAVTFTTSLVHAESVYIGGHSSSGHVRHHLHLNLTPAASTSYTPSQIRHAYGVDQLSATGAGQKIALIVSYGNPNIQSYLNTFSSTFGLNATTIQILGNNAGGNSSWAMETALDVEWAHAIAPGATLILSVSPSNSLTDLLNAIDAAVKAGATVVSMSWGGSEFSSMSYYDFHFNKSNVTFTASSGDNGAGIEWPAVSPYVIGVGGTSLYLDSNLNRSSETAWSGSGGGTSTYYPRPSYQNGWHTSSNRGVPDVCMVADPSTGLKIYNGSWVVVGGTSASAPQWAGLIALANQARVANGSSALTTPNNLLYLIAKGSTTTPYSVNSTYFFDVSEGSNGAFSAGPPYDFVTGLGSPIANRLIPTLAPSSLSAPAAPTGLTATGKTGEIDLQWNASSGATSYAVARATSSGGSYTVIASGLSTTSYRDTSASLVPGTTYYYKVAAANSAGSSSYTSAVSAVIPVVSGVPAAPSNLTATATSSTQISLNWVNHASNATGISIEVSISGGSFFQLGTTGSGAIQCPISGATSKTTYSFRLRAYNSSGYSAYCNVATVTTP